METGVYASMLAPPLAGFVSAAIGAVLVRTRSLPLDKPNERSLHAVPVPRTGGLAIMSGVVAAALLLQTDLTLMGPAVALAVVSYADDRHALPVMGRLALHLVATGVFLWMAAASVALATFIFLLLAVAWLTNLYNFMDGSDGLAGGMTVMGFATYSMAAWLGGNADLALFAGSIAAAAAGFLIFNFPPAKLFMGDVGSIPLGFLAGALGIAGWLSDNWPLWFPLVVFAPFIVDASITLARRLLRGERAWQAHRQHYYQRLILSGWSHRRTAVGAYGLMLLCSVVAMVCWLGSRTTQVSAISALVLLIAVTLWSIDRRWARTSVGRNV